MIPGTTFPLRVDDELIFSNTKLNRFHLMTKGLMVDDPQRKLYDVIANLKKAKYLVIYCLTTLFPFDFI